MQKPWIKRFLGLLWIGLLVWGVVGVVQRVTLGHTLAHYGSYVPWGLPVVAYIYFVGLSAGLILFWCTIQLFSIARLECVRRLTLLLAAITLLMGLVSIFFDLGQMGRALEIFTRPHWTSVMTWIVWLYTVYLVWIVIALWFELRSDPASRRVLRGLAGFGLPLAIAFCGGVGALFATVSGKVAWHSGLLPILFLLGALVSGIALVPAVRAVIGPRGEQDGGGVTRLLSRIVLALLLGDLLLEWAEISIPIWYGVGAESDIWHTVLFGQFWWVFWIVHIAIGSVIPIVLLAAKPACRTASGIAGGLIVITFIAVRLNVVLPGQVLEPAFRGLAQAYRDHRLQFSYMPSAFEWSLLAFVVAVGLGLLSLGLHYLPLSEHPEWASAASQSPTETNG